MKIVFLSAMCALDTRSGAARAMRTLLEWLAVEGWQAHSISASLFDGAQEYPLAKLFGPAGGAQEHWGKVLMLEQSGVEHRVVRFASTQGQKATAEEKRRLLEAAERRLAEIKPDIVVSYGRNHAVSHGLWRAARRHAKHLVFYLANGHYDDADTFQAFDRVLCPSRWLADYYRERLGIAAGVLPVMIAEDSYAPAHEVLATSNISARRQGLITYINPVPEKGATLFLRLARLAQTERPDLTFLCVEGRMAAQAWRAQKADLAGLPNVWWIPNQQDMRRVYRRTSILLFPSFGPEAAGRSISEAQLGGIPVLGTRRGGIPEQMNGGGFLFDVPEVCRENYRRIPPPEAVRPWLETICTLLDDDRAYLTAVQRAHHAAEPFRPEQRRQDVAAQFAQLLERD